MRFEEDAPQLSLRPPVEDPRADRRGVRLPRIDFPLRAREAKRVLRIVDHASIYLLIAGTYTPFALVSLRGPWGWSLFGVVWGIALIGVVSQVSLLRRPLHFNVLGEVWVADARLVIQQFPDALPVTGVAARRALRGVPSRNQPPQQDVAG